MRRLLTKDEVQERIELTTDQQKAWKQFERAVKRCKDTGIRFYQVLDSVGALDGRQIRTIDNAENTVHDGFGPRGFNCLSYPYIQLTDSWDDDPHVVIFEDDE